jgi:hypothetical protein
MRQVDQRLVRSDCWDRTIDNLVCLSRLVQDGLSVDGRDLIDGHYVGRIGYTNSDVARVAVLVSEQ